MIERSFKETNTFEDRQKSSGIIKQKYPDRVPVVCEKHPRCKDLKSIDKKKYLVPSDLTMGQFIYVIRNRIKLEPSQGIFLFINNKIVPSSTLISLLYDKNKDEDGFLYISYTSENTFG